MRLGAREIMIWIQKGGDKKSARVVEDFYIDMVYKLSPSCQSWISEKNMALYDAERRRQPKTVTPAPAWMDHGGRGNAGMTVNIIVINDNKRGHLKSNLSP